MRHVKLQKAGVIKPITEVRGGVLPVSNDVLCVLDHSWNGMLSKVDSSNSTNMPQGVSHALKRYFQFDNDNVVVDLLEIYPTYGRRWINLYSTGSGWRGWKSVTPQ